VLRPGGSWTGPETIIAHLEQVRLARQKIPTYWEVVPALPATASGKVRKQELRPSTGA